MDTIKTYTLQNVEVQANGIIRNEKGRLIARLVNDIDFEGEHIKGVADNLEFQRELASVVNKHSKERLGGNTPDFILANYLVKCLKNFGDSINLREPEKEINSLIK